MLSRASRIALHFLRCTWSRKPHSFTTWSTLNACSPFRSAQYSLISLVFPSKVCLWNVQHLWGLQEKYWPHYGGLHLSQNMITVQILPTYCQHPHWIHLPSSLHICNRSCLNQGSFMSLVQLLTVQTMESSEHSSLGMSYSLVISILQLTYVSNELSCMSCDPPTGFHRQPIQLLFKDWMDAGREHNSSAEAPKRFQ